MNIRNKTTTKFHQSHPMPNAPIRTQHSSVTGSDHKINPVANELRTSGVLFFFQCNRGPLSSRVSLSLRFHHILTFLWFGRDFKSSLFLFCLLCFFFTRSLLCYLIYEVPFWQAQDRYDKLLLRNKEIISKSFFRITF